MSLYAYTEHGANMVFSGATTQSSACQQHPDACGDDLDNTPLMGWNQLWYELKSNPVTEQDNLRWSTDMMWLNP
jgi:hypothetical protein